MISVKKKNYYTKLLTESIKEKYPIKANQDLSFSYQIKTNSGTFQPRDLNKKQRYNLELLFSHNLSHYFDIDLNIQALLLFPPHLQQRELFIFPSFYGLATAVSGQMSVRANC